MSKRRKFRFSVRRMPLSTSPFASLSRTCLSWYPIFMIFHVSPTTVKVVGSWVLPLMRSIHDPTLIFSDDLIILRASSSSASPVNRSSMASLSRSAKSNRRREESFCIDILDRKANSNKIHPRKVYEILSFQNDKYPLSLKRDNFRDITCLSFNPRRRTSS